MKYQLHFLYLSQLEIKVIKKIKAVKEEIILIVFKSKTQLNTSIRIENLGRYKQKAPRIKLKCGVT